MDKASAGTHPAGTARKTLTRFTIEKEHENRDKDPTGEFSGLLNAVATAVKVIANQVGKGALAGLPGDAGAVNVQGDAQKKLDVVSNAVMIGETEWTGHLAGMVSQEMPGVYPDPSRLPPRQVPAGVRPAGRIKQPGREHHGGHDLLHPA